MADKTLPQIRTAKVTMEQAMQKALNDLVAAFQKETGLAVTEINVNVFQLRSEQPASVVEDVRTEVDPQL